MILLQSLLIGVVASQSGDGLGLEAPTGWKRQEDPEKRFVQYIPPNVPAGGDCTVLVYPPTEYPGSAETFLEAMVVPLRQGKRSLGDVQRMDIGIFKAAIISQQNAQGQNEFLALHTVKVGTKVHAVLYGANDAALYKARTPDVLAMLNKAKAPAAAAVSAAPVAPAAGGVAIAGLNLPLPPGWAQEKADAGWIRLIPPETLFPGDQKVWVLPTQKIEGSHWTAHRALLEALVASAKWADYAREIADVAPGPFIRTKARCTTDRRTIRLFTAVAGDQMEALVIAPDSNENLQTELLPVLERTTLRNAAEAPKRPTVVEAYRLANKKQYLNVDGSMVSGKVRFERILLLSNGAADLNPRYGEGLDGFAGLAKIDAGCQNGFYGKWTADGTRVRLLRDARQAEQVYERENGTLKFGNQVWNPMPRVDGLKLKGRYADKSQPGAALQYDYWFEFAEEGTFRTGGGLTSLAVLDQTGRPKPPDSCSGTYEIRDWTIWFKVDGRPIWSTDFMTTGEDLTDLKIVLIDATGFIRE